MGVYRMYKGLDGRPRIIHHTWRDVVVGILIGVAIVAAACWACWDL